MTDHAKGSLNVIAAALLWSFGGLLIKKIGLNPDASQMSHGLVIAGSRSLIAAVVIWFFARPITFRWRSGSIYGALAYAGTVIFFVLATRMTTASNAILLQYTAPIYAALLSARMLREPVSRVDWISIFFVLVGMVIFFLRDLSGSGPIGDMLAIVSGIFFALCIVYLRRERNESPLGIVLLGNLITAAIGLPFMIGDAPSSGDIGLLLLLGTFQLGLGYVLFVRGVRYISAVEGTLVSMLEPLLNPLWVALFVGEYPSTLAVIGGGVVIVTVAVRGVWMRPHPSSRSEPG